MLTDQTYYQNQCSKNVRWRSLFLQIDSQHGTEIAPNQGAHLAFYAGMCFFLYAIAERSVVEGSQKRDPYSHLRPLSFRSWMALGELWGEENN